MIGRCGIPFLCLFMTASSFRVRTAATTVAVERSPEDIDPSIFSWQDCGESDDRTLRVTSFSMVPMPMRLPGRLTVSFGGSVSRVLQKANVELVISKEQSIFGYKYNTTVPCLFKLGSCTYEDTCSLLDRMERENWLSVSSDIARQIRRGLVINDLPTTCPLEAREVDIQNMVFDLPAIPSLFRWFADGRYFAKVKFIDDATNAQLGCVEVKMTVA